MDIFGSNFTYKYYIAQNLSRSGRSLERCSKVLIKLFLSQEMLPDLTYTYSIFCLMSEFPLFAVLWLCFIV